MAVVTVIGKPQTEGPLYEPGCPRLNNDAVWRLVQERVLSEEDSMNKNYLQ